jgi:hypothetical protein
MKFFTREWANGELPDDEWAETAAAYRRHLDLLLPSLPESVARLAREINLHDGLIRRVSVDRRADELVLNLRCGDLQTGYFDLDLVYLGVDLSSVDLVTLANCARDPETELVYDEVDLDAQENYLHRILFGPAGEVSIPFSRLQVECTAQPDRSFPPVDDPYVARS